MDERFLKYFYCFEFDQAGTGLRPSIIPGILISQVSAGDVEEEPVGAVESIAMLVNGVHDE